LSAFRQGMPGSQHLGKKKAPNSGEGWALLRFHATPGGKPASRCWAFG
jgi:hypothetical protein